MAVFQQEPAVARHGVPGGSPWQAGNHRPGFTLLEVILATSLSIVLLAALYAVLKLHLTYAQKAPQQVERTLEARAIVDIIAKDIRAVIPPLAMPSESGASAAGASASSGGAASGASESTTNTTQTSSLGSSTDPNSYRAAYGVLGGTDWLQLYVGRGSSNLDDMEQASWNGSVAQTSDVVRVAYALTLLTTRQDSKGRTQRLALTRSEVASIGAERLDTSADETDVQATTSYLGDDIAHIQFQYWDDYSAQWLDSWGVDVPIAAPRAIKVLVSLQDPDEYLETQLGLSGGQSTWEPSFQVVIPIATWVPDSDSSSLSSAGM
jgi:hypothetical protein